MATLKCPDCGYEVSDKALQCPCCGRPIKGHLHEIYFELADRAQAQRRPEAAAEWAKLAMENVPEGYEVPEQWKPSIAKARTALYKEVDQQIQQEDEAVRQQRLKEAQAKSAQANAPKTMVTQPHAQTLKKANDDFYEQFRSETGESTTSSGDTKDMHTTAELGGGELPEGSVNMGGLGTEILKEVQRKKRLRLITMASAGAVLLVAVVGWAVWHKPASAPGTSTPAAASAKASQKAKSNEVLLGSALVPEWVQGTYEGEITDENGTSALTLTINADGTLFQRLTNAGRAINISGTVATYDRQRGLGVKLDGHAEQLYYPVDTLHHRLSIGHDIWLEHK